MSSVVIKIGSLVIKSLSKPIATQIKLQAREHERFRGYCISIAQRIHQWDMRFRLGLLQDQAAIDKQIAQEAAERAAEKHKHRKATARTEAEARAEDEAAKVKDKAKEKAEEKPKKRPKIRPLTEAKAIDSGANFVSETFLLFVAVACVIGERWYSSRRESSRREDVAEQLEELRREVIALRAKAREAPPKPVRILPKEVYELNEQEGEEQAPKGWFARIAAYIARTQDEPKPEVRKPEVIVKQPKEVQPPTTASAPTPPQRSTIIDSIVQSTPFSSATKSEQPSKSPPSMRGDNAKSA